MKTVGFALIGAGIVALLLAFGFDAAPEGSYNIGLLQHQMMLLQTASLLCIVGTIVSCAAIALAHVDKARDLLGSGSSKTAGDDASSPHSTKELQP